MTVLLTAIWAMPTVGSAAHAALHATAGHSDHGSSAIAPGQGGQNGDAHGASVDEKDHGGRCSGESGAQNACCGMPCHAEAMPADCARMDAGLKTERAVIAALESVTGSRPWLLERPPRASSSSLG